MFIVPVKCSDYDTLRFSLPHGADRVRKMKIRRRHLSEANQRALISLVTESNYENGVRRAALEAAQDNCGSRRWQIGWTSYKHAADENEHTF
jgi:hypothetical protein